MDTSKTIDQNLDNFNKILLDLGNSGKKFEDEDVSIILLKALLDSFDEVKNAIKYGRDTLSTSIVINAIRSKEFDTKVRKEKSGGSNSRESYYTRGKSSYKKHFHKGKIQSRGKSRGKSGDRKCF